MAARPPVFDAEAYKGRNVVERCFNRLKQFRALATRYTKRAAYYRTELTLAAIILWLRDSPDTASVQVRALRAQDKRTLRLWLTRGERSRSDLDRIYDLARMLGASDRAQLREYLEGANH
ncbi:transposase [Myceligenerans xiligouense]|uniref:transposase n=1 Tax=Myceligenerans xiligouense TaxID=253184 RepID=UPI001476C700|nr:transposase [Myceligenerans xiligouense]